MKARRCAIQTCVEVKRTSDAVYVRDSKQANEDGYTIISSTHPQWREFLAAVALESSAGSTEAFSYRSEENGDVLLSGAEGTLNYDAEEWSAFLDGVREGDFDLDPASVS